MEDIRALQQRISLYEDMKAYEDLYNLLFPELHRFSFALVKSSEAAEEIVSDVFIKIWMIRGTLMNIVHLRVYLFTITRNFSLNYITRNFKMTAVSLETLDVEAVVDVQGPEESCISADLVKQIHQVIQALPPQCRIVFQLVKEDGMKYKEVAEILGISSLTVRNHVSLATKKIAKMFPAYLYPAIYRRDLFSKS